MTVRERTGIRDLTFSKWIRKNLPDSKTGFMVTDVDFVFFNYRSGKLVLLEVKTFNKEIQTWQKKLFGMLDRIICNSSIVKSKEIKYLGYFLLTFEKTCFHDGNAFLVKKGDKKVQKISEQQFIDLFSL